VNSRKCPTFWFWWGCLVHLFILLYSDLEAATADSVPQPVLAPLIEFRSPQFELHLPYSPPLGGLAFGSDRFGDVVRAEGQESPEVVIVATTYSKLP
jgi:hypothetical protein